MNLERGFRRITWVTSVPLFLLGIALVGIGGWNRLDSWNRAGEPLPDDEVWVYVSCKIPIRSTVVSFPLDVSEQKITQVLDEEFAREWSKKGMSAKEFLDQTIDAHKIALFYFCPFSNTPSVLYSRKAILQAEAVERLTREQQEVLSGLRIDHHFPYPISRPFSVWEWIGYISLAVGVAAVPWGVFFLTRWIVRGFKNDPPPRTSL